MAEMRQPRQENEHGQRNPLGSCICRRPRPGHTKHADQGKNGRSLYTLTAAVAKLPLSW
jgi:hypothetical protein